MNMTLSRYQGLGYHGVNMSGGQLAASSLHSAVGLPIDLRSVGQRDSQWACPAQTRPSKRGTIDPIVVLLACMINAATFVSQSTRDAPSFRVGLHVVIGFSMDM